MLLGAISKINPIILEFTILRHSKAFNKKTNIKAKKRKNNQILVKVEFNLECGNIRKNNMKWRK